MTEQRITTIERTTSNGSTRAGNSVVRRELTEVYVDGELVNTIIWNAPLLQRLERTGVTRAAYVARIAGRSL